MIPVEFDESTKTLSKPESMIDEECASLPVYNDGEVCISKWRMSWIERLHCLIRGYVWIWVLSGATQPPIAIDATKTVFKKVEG